MSQPMGTHPDVCSSMAVGGGADAAASTADCAASGASVDAAGKGKCSVSQSQQAGMPGSHPDRHELAPGAVITLMANLQHKATQKVQAAKVAAVVDAVLGPPEAAPRQAQLFQLPVRLRDLHYAPKVAGSCAALDASRVLLRLDQPSDSKRLQGHWWLLSPAGHTAAEAAAVAAGALAAPAAGDGLVSKPSVATSASTATADVSPSTVAGDQLLGATVQEVQAAATAATEPKQEQEQEQEQAPDTAAAAEQQDGGQEAASVPGAAAAATAAAAGAADGAPDIMKDALGILAAELKLLLAKNAASQGPSVADAAAGEDGTAPDSAAAAAGPDDEPAAEQQVKRRRIDDTEGSPPAPAAAAVVAEPDAAAAGADGAVPADDLAALQMVEALAVQIEALSKKVDSTSKAVFVPSAAASSSLKSSDSPGLPPMQEQVPHHSRSSLAVMGGAQAYAAQQAAPAAAAGRPLCPSSRVVQQQHEGTMSSYARLKAKAEAEAAAAARAAAAAQAAAVPDSAAAAGVKRQLDSAALPPQKRSAAAAAAATWQAIAASDSSDEDEDERKPGYVPKWLREWRPKARAAAAAANSREQRRKGAAGAAAHRKPPGAPQHPHQQCPRQGQWAREGSCTADSSGQQEQEQEQEQQHHKHLALMLAALMEDAAGTPSQHACPAAAAAAPTAAAEGARGAAWEEQQLGVASFVFKADMLPAKQQGAAADSHHSSWDGSGPESPEVAAAAAGGAGAFGKQRAPSQEPQMARSGSQPAQQQQQAKERRPSGSNAAQGEGIFALPKREWQKLSAAAGLHALQRQHQQVQAEDPLLAQQQDGKQEQQEQLAGKPGCSNVHSARAVLPYRGVFAVEGSSLFEVRMHRSKLGTMVRLKNHADAIAAARAFDRAALCLARAHMSSRAPELNFPAEEYEGERLPDLRGKDPSEIREVLTKAFSGRAVPAAASPDANAGPASGSSSPGLPAPQPQQLQKWLPQDSTAATAVQGAQADASLGQPVKGAGQTPQVQVGSTASAAGLKPARTVGAAAPAAAAHAWHPGAAPQAAAAHAAAFAAAAAGSNPAGFIPAGPGPLPGQRMGAPTAIVRELQQGRQHHVQPQQFPQQLQLGPGLVHQGMVPFMGHMRVDAPHMVAAVPPQMLQQVPMPPPQQQQSGESALLAKMLTDLQAMSRHCFGVQGCLQQFEYALIHDPAAAEAAMVAGPTTREEVRSTLAAVGACQKQQAALQQLLAETVQLLQPALTEEERQRLQRNSVQLAPALNALSERLSDVCRAVLRAAVAQDAAACAAAAVAGGTGGNPAAAAAAGALAAAGHSGLLGLHQAITPSLDNIPAGSARAQRMARLSRAIRASQDSMAAARKVLSGQA